MKMNFSRFKLISRDKNAAVLRHPDGHEVKIAMKALSPKNREEIHKMPMMAKGGSVEPEMGSKERAIVSPSRHLSVNTTAMMKQAPQRQSNPKLEQSRQNFDAGGMAEPLQVDPGAAASAPPPSSPRDYTPPSGSQNQAMANPIGQMPATDEDMPYGVTQDAMQNAAQQAASRELSTRQQAAGIAQKALDSPQPLSQQGLAPQQGANPAVQEKMNQQTLLGQATEAEKSANTEMAKHQAELATHAVNMQNLAIAGMQDLRDNTQADMQAHQKEIADAVHDFASGHVDPNHYLGSMSTAGKISSGIGLILGGIGSGLTGGPNMALDFLNKQIDRDIEAQKMQIGKKDTLVSMYSKMLGNDRAGEEMARQTMMATAGMQANKAAMQSNSAMATDRAKVLNAQIDAQRAPGLAQMSMMTALSKTVQQGKQNNADPAYFVPMMVPPGEQPKVFSEIERAQNTRRQGQEILKNFDQAVEDTKGFGRVGSMIKQPRSLQALHQGINTTVTDLTGTARQAEFDSAANNLTPSNMDSAADTATRRKSLQDYLKAKSSAPTAKGHGIDLDTFGSTNLQQMGQQQPQASNQPEIKTMGGKQYQKVAGGWKPIQ